MFGKIVDGKMVLNDVRKMIDKWCLEIPKKFSDVELGIYQIMPNHFHMILINHGLVGAALSVRPNVTNINNVDVVKKGGNARKPLQVLVII